MDNLYKVDDMPFYTRRLVVNEGTLERLAYQIWLLAQSLIIIYAIDKALGMPIQALVVALSISWVVWHFNKF